MEPLEIARKLASYGESGGACKAYTLALENGMEDDFAAQLEAAVYILQFGGNYKIAYTTFVTLYRKHIFEATILSIMDDAFFDPNIKEMRSKYQKNCQLLKKYPFFFRDDFPDFNELPIKFYPYDEHSYTPFDVSHKTFGNFIDFKEPTIKHHFFHDLEKPILAENIFSQYELEYLNDNVRKSEYIGRENHIYLYYDSWTEFCSYLPCLNLRILLKDQKFVFLFDSDKTLYPIDFKDRFGIDYSKYTPRPIGIREVNRLIWHTQLSSHNGGDFFNEIFDNHPNLLVMPSLLMSNAEEASQKCQDVMKEIKSHRDALNAFQDWKPYYADEIFRIKNCTEKDMLVGIFLNDSRATVGLDHNSRIAPALFFQPHFHNIVYKAELDDKNRALLFSEQYDNIRTSAIFRNFKYIKTFTPMRRITTSYGGTIKFMLKALEERTEEENIGVIDDAVFTRILNRSYLVDPQDRLYKDSVLVRFEDGKLNPKATFQALAAFLDLPYTGTMTYCSEWGERDPLTEGNVIGFDAATVYRKYDDFSNDAERCFIEYFMRDAYETYGYDFQYYDGALMNEERVEKLINQFTTLDRFIRDSWREVFKAEVEKQTEGLTGEAKEEVVERMLDDMMADMNKERLRIAGILLHGLKFVNRNGQPFRMMSRLELNPELLEQPLYH